MEVFITGGSGFIGRALCHGLMEAGFQPIVLSRSAETARRLPRGVGHCLGDPSQPGSWQDEAGRYRLFVNLAGASIFSRWNAAYKKTILESRIDSTRNLAQAMDAIPASEKPVLISASAVGYYGFTDDEELTEDSPGGEDFLATVCRQWEAEARMAETKGARVVRTRFGVVLGPGGGALTQMLPIFRKGLGGPLGSGRQWLSWIHHEDLVRALIFCLEHSEINGAVNCTSPHPATNREFARALGRALGRPAVTPAPAFAVKLAMGELATVLLNGQRVLPMVLLEAGFNFGFGELDKALAQVTAREPAGKL